MTAVAVTLALASILLGGVAWVALQRARRAEAQLDALSVVPPPHGEQAIVITVRNHHDLAAQRTPLARAVSAITPGVIRGIVHREVVRELRAELREQGVDAEVRLRRVLPAVEHAAQQPDGHVEQDGAPPPEDLPPGA